MKYLTHWLTAFVTVVLLTYVGLQDPGFKETLRLKSFDYLLANEEKTLSEDITIIAIDEQAIEKYGQFPWSREVLLCQYCLVKKIDLGKMNFFVKH